MISSIIPYAFASSASSQKSLSESFNSCSYGLSQKSASNSNNILLYFKGNNKEIENYDIMFQKVKNDVNDENEDNKEDFNVDDI